MINPYWGKGFFGVLGTFFQRMGSLLFGNVGISDLASDELQILVLSILGLSSAIVGSFLVLRKMTMLANSISHTILIGIVIPVAIMRFFHSLPDGTGFTIDMKILLISSLITAFLTMFFTDFLTRVLKIQRDASIGLVFSFMFALGIIALTILTRNSHIGAEIIMGNVDMLHYKDLFIIGSVAICNIFLVVLLFKELVITSFDPMQAKLSRISHLFISYILMFMTSLTVISGLRVVGVVLVLSFLVTPALIARLISKKVSTMLIYASVISITIAFFSVALSRHLATTYGFYVSTTGLIVTIQFSSYIFSFGLLSAKRYITRVSSRKRLIKGLKKH